MRSLQLFQTPTRGDCIRSGALFSARKCGGCDELTARGLHHCERFLADLAVSLGGLSQADVAFMLGVDVSRVRQVEEDALRKAGIRLMALARTNPREVPPPAESHVRACAEPLVSEDANGQLTMMMVGT